MSKLYNEPTAIGAVSELILATLNTNVHVYNVSPALTVIEKQVAKSLAALFGFDGPYAGGTTQAGGSASNMTALVIARNTLFPDTKTKGYSGKRLVLFTSKHGHYSFEKAAQICGLGSEAAWSVAVDAQGRMIPAELEKEVKRAKAEGFVPFFVNATAGSTVLGSYDPFHDIAEICKRENLWCHVDASWGGAVVFSAAQRYKMDGCGLADSITYNPHKMLNIPVTCSFLLAKDTRQFWKSNTLPANYLFHSKDDEDVQIPNGHEEETEIPSEEEIWDLADMTLQCGRKGDALKLALSWIYYGSNGFEARIDHAFSVAAYMARLVEEHPKLILVSETPPPCLQVCFMYKTASNTPEDNTRVTRDVAKKLLAERFHVDFAAGDYGSFLRVVVGLQTRRETVERLVDLVGELGAAAAGG